MRIYRISYIPDSKSSSQPNQSGIRAIDCTHIQYDDYILCMNFLQESRLRDTIADAMRDAPLQQRANATASGQIQQPASAKSSALVGHETTTTSHISAGARRSSGSGPAHCSLISFDANGLLAVDYTVNCSYTGLAGTENLSPVYKKSGISEY